MTASITLKQSTGDIQIDSLLIEIITEYEAELLGCVSGYYVMGSYADGSGVGSSDLDVCLVIGDCQLGERERARVLAEMWKAKSQVELDIEIEEKEHLSQGIAPNFKYGSIWLYGEDIRQDIPLVPLRVWTRDRMHSSYWRTVQLFGRSTPVCMPLEYPDPQGEFFGYDARLLRLADGREVRCTRDLIRLVGWSATGLLAWKTGVYVARKKDCHRLYQEAFADEWGQLLQDIYEKCRVRWDYLLPEDEVERQELRELCRRTLGFENYFLRMYKEFLLEELRVDDAEGRRWALWALGKLPFGDQEVEVAMGERL